jgi:hypothetical protein
MTDPLHRLSPRVLRLPFFDINSQRSLIAIACHKVIRVIVPSILWFLYVDRIPQGCEEVRLLQ